MNYLIRLVRRAVGRERPEVPREPQPPTPFVEDIDPYPTMIFEATPVLRESGVSVEYHRQRQQS
jgi:hypothetical protein